MSFANYAYNKPYAQCMASGENGSVRKLEDSYLQKALRGLGYVHKMCMDLYGRDTLCQAKSPAMFPAP
ncbi:hypothetical protein [Tunturiibacter lichenicola]|uniref:hypothetical protein n=1 Tax=Tunturiibacter lichenicola TaxID=2051959 RepID=UPI003D9AEF43